MLKVKDLIRELKKQPQNLYVAFAHADVGEYPIDAWIYAVNHIEKVKIERDREVEGDMPDEWVNLSD